MDRRAFVSMVAAGLLAAPLAAEAQPAKKYRIGLLGLRDFQFLTDERYQALLRPFTEGLRARGWVENQNIVIERRYAERPEQYPALAAD